MKKVIAAISLIFFSTFLFAADSIIVLVYPFANAGSSQYSWISAGMTDSVISDLERIKNISVVSDSDRKNAVKEVELAQTGILSDKAVSDLGKLTGANTVITGSYSVSGEKIKVKVRLIPVGVKGKETTFDADGTLDGIFDLQDRIVYGLISESEKLNNTTVISDAEKKTIEGKYKPKLSAYELYAKGWEIAEKKPHEALEFYKQAIAADPEYVDPLIEAGWLTGSVFNRYNEALGYLQKAETKITKRNDALSEKYATMLNAFGAIHLSSGQADKSISYYIKTKELLEKSGKSGTFQYGNLLVNLGNACKYKNDLNSALDYYVKAKQLFESLQLQKSINYAVLLFNIGNLCRDGNQPDAALKYYNLSKGIFEGAQGGDKYSYYANLMLNIGILYGNKKNDGATASDYFKKSDELYKTAGLNNTAEYAVLMFHMGVNESDKNYNLALSFYDKGIAIYESLGNRTNYNYGALLWNAAIAYQNLNQKKKSGENYRKACNVFKTIGESELSQKADERAKQFGY